MLYTYWVTWAIEVTWAGKSSPFDWLKEINRLRTTREELGRLLGRGLGGGMPDDSQEIFRPFREVSALRWASSSGQPPQELF